MAGEHAGGAAFRSVGDTVGKAAKAAPRPVRMSHAGRQRRCEVGRQHPAITIDPLIRNVTIIALRPKLSSFGKE
ncbi:MAG: hypothetical protein ACRDQX_07900 [Pseudonocardiaceae bacterium]